jgi:hypothetical protein
MDDFGDRPELNGTLMSLEFGLAGRIQQLWASDPSLPEEGEEFQFILGPVSFGEEFSEDYFPGTIMIGARQNAGEPWILSRNADAELLEEEDGVPSVRFAYDLPLLPEIEARGHYYEIREPIPQVVWDVTLRNRGRSPVEIGEVAFPFALNNLYEGFPKTDKGIRTLYNDRVHIHKFIGGAASYLFAQRLNSETPGLLIFPGEGTVWEFYNHVPASLNTPYRWQGIPVVYVHSRAAMEREGWGGWANDHSSLMLGPGESRTFQTRFVPSDRDRYDHLHQTLAICGHPAIKLLPGAVAPAEVGIAVEIGGATPTRFLPSKDADMETDADEEGGFCFLRPKEAGQVTLQFEDTKGRLSYTHLFFTEPIETLIKKRAEWIVENQVHDDPTSAFHRSILLANIRNSKRLTDAEHYAGPFAVESGLSDALFLAEKNTIYPDRNQIQILDCFIREYLRDDIQNPGDNTVGTAFADTRSVALNYSRPHAYALVFNLYHSMYRVANVFGETHLKPREYLKLAAGTAIAMFRHGLNGSSKGTGMPGYARVLELLSDLEAQEMEEAEVLSGYVAMRAEDLLKRDSPYAGESIWDTSGFEEVFAAARYMNDEEHLERALRCAYAARALSPSWWWYGSDVRFFDDSEGLAHPGIADKGELCLGYTTPENSMMFLGTLDRDYSHIPEAYMRLAFGGMLGVWALVRPDGAASMAYCPDASSKQHGMLPLTGDIGFALFHYLRGVGAYVLPSRSYGVFTFGCHFEIDDTAYVVRPWDGVGRHVILRQVGAEFSTTFGRIREVRLDLRKRWAVVEIESPADKHISSLLHVRGMWGNTFEVSGKTVNADDGELAVPLALPPLGIIRVDIKVVE